MDNSRIESERRSIERYEKSIEDDLRLIHVLATFSKCFYGNNKTKKLRSYYQSIISSKSQKRKISHLNDLIKFLDNCSKKGIEFLIDSDRIRSELEKKYINKDYRNSLEELEYSIKIGIKIKEACSRIISNYGRINYSKERIKEYEKGVRPEKKQEDTENKNTKFKENKKAKEFSSKREDNRVSKPISKFKDSSKEIEPKNTTKVVSIDISNLTEDNKGYFKKGFRETLLSEHVPNILDTFDTSIENGLIIKRFQQNGLSIFKSKYSPRDVLDFAMNTFEVLPNYLEDYHMIEDNSIKEVFRKTRILDSLSEYEKIYNKYMKSYSLMTKTNKEDHNRQISSYWHRHLYEDYFGERDFSSPNGCMLKPEELRKYVNKKIIANKAKKYYNSADIRRLIESSRLFEITRFMNGEETARLYHSIKSKWIEDEKWHTPYNAEDVDSALQSFQIEIVRLIVRKLYPKEVYNLMGENFNNFVQDKYDEICNSILHEDPIKDKKFN